MSYESCDVDRFIYLFIYWKLFPDLWVCEKLKTALYSRFFANFISKWLA